MGMIDRVCMYCCKIYGQKEGGGETRATHGACPECSIKALAEVDAYFAAKNPTLNPTKEARNDARH